MADALTHTYYILQPLRLRHEANTINEEITKLALGNYMVGSVPQG
jgi:hypothetical protein